MLARLTSLAFRLSGGLAFVYKRDELSAKLSIEAGTMKTCNPFNENCLNSKVVGL